MRLQCLKYLLSVHIRGHSNEDINNVNYNSHCSNTTAKSFVSLVNSTDGTAVATAMGTGGHTDVPLATIDSAAFTRLFEQANW